MNRSDPFLANCFALELDGVITTKFSRCEGLESEKYVYEVEEGGYGIHRFEGRTRFPNLVLEKGISTCNELYEWYQDTIHSEKPIERRSGSVILMDQNGEEMKRWNFHRALPCRWVGPTLDFRSTSVAIEKFEIAYEELWEVDDMSVGSVQSAMYNNRHQKYEEGENDCDPWVDNLIETSILHENPLANPDSHDVPGHQKKMGPGQDTPSEGVNVHIKDGHMSIVIKQGDTYTVGHQGENKAPLNGENNYSETYVYTSREAFEASFWGNGTYYPVY